MLLFFLFFCFLVCISMKVFPVVGHGAEVALGVSVWCQRKDNKLLLVPACWRGSLRRTWDQETRSLKKILTCNVTGSVEKQWEWGTGKRQSPRNSPKIKNKERTPNMAIDRTLLEASPTSPSPHSTLCDYMKNHFWCGSSLNGVNTHTQTHTHAGVCRGDWSL